MNPKVKKLRAEREKNCEKIARFTARNEEIDREIMKLENTDIIGMVRSVGMTPDQLFDLLKTVVSVDAECAPEPQEQDGGEDQSYTENQENMEGQDNAAY